MPFSRYTKYIILLILIALAQFTFSQKSYPKNYFQSPLDIRLLLSGTFGEVRANHFHSGIDIKTGGVEGSVVYAVADGFVSRIKVSVFGYGRAIYITHPNGYVSVYGHLNRYNKVIEDYVRKEQYNKESFEIELFPYEGEILVKKGDIIAYSGNSGSSGGPHLHFEIRDGASEKPINPLLFGYDVKDVFRPHISYFKIYPEDENARINGNNRSYSCPVEGWGEGHRLNVSQSIRLSGNVSFAIQVSDQQNDTDNKNGPYSIALYIDSELVFEYRMETFSFDDIRYVNSLLDYAGYMKSGVLLQRTRIDPGNKLKIYGKTGKQGTFCFNDTLQHVITYDVKDVAGNTALLTFNVKSEKPEILVSKQSSTSNSQLLNFNYNTSNHFENGSIILDAPAGVFYDSFTFKYDSTRQITGTYSSVYKIHDKFTPVHDYIALSIKPCNLPERLRDKALIVKINDDGKSFTSSGGKWAGNGYVTTKIREFGNYSVSVDTIPPRISPVQPETFKNLTTQKKVKFIITDERSGISSYRGTLNGKWVLMEYDAKNDLLFYTIDDRLLKGENNMKLVVVDMKNNRKTYQAILER